MATTIRPKPLRSSRLPAEDATALRQVVLTYVEALPDPGAVQCLLVILDVLIALGLTRKQIQAEVGVAAEACMCLLAGAKGEEGP